MFRAAATARGGETALPSVLPNIHTDRRQNSVERGVQFEPRRTSSAMYGHHNISANSTDATRNGKATITKKSLRGRLMQARRAALEMVDRGDARAGLKELLRALKLRASNTGKLPKTEQLWEYAEEYVLLANNEAVRRNAAAEPLDDVQHYFSEALRLVGNTEVEEGTRETRKSRRFSSAPWKQTTDHFAGHPILKRALHSMVLNSVAVLQRTTEEPLSTVTASLLHALKESDGVFCTLILYNLAAAFTTQGLFDDAAEAVARCMELAMLYLDIPPPSHVAGSTSSKAPTPETALQMEDRLAHSTFITTVATHAIMCHHLVATLSAWCGMYETERYQCQLAVGCARKYLLPSHPLQQRCINRWKASVGGPGCALPHANTGIPPQMPLVAQADFTAIPCNQTVPADAALGAAQAATPVTGPSVRVSALLSLCAHVKTPVELIRYIAAADKYLLQYACDRVSFPRVCPSGSSEMAVSVGNPKLLSKRTRGASLTMFSKPCTPCHVTLLPRKTFNRYRHLHKEALSYLEEPQQCQGVGSHSHRSEGIRTPTSSPDAHPRTSSSHSQRSVSTCCPPTTLITLEGVESTPSQFMRDMDMELLRYSKLVPDRTPEFQGCAARKIQRCWRQYAAHLNRRRRQDCVTVWHGQREAAECILQAYRHWKERLAARELLRPLRVARHLSQCATVIQRYVLYKRGVEEWGERCLTRTKKLVHKKLQRELEDGAATLLQAWWRSCYTRAAFRRQMVAAIRVQTAWRCRVARLELMSRRVKRRFEVEALCRKQLPYCVTIQRWWWACRARRDAKADFLTRQQANQEYLASVERAFEAECARFGHAFDIGDTANKVMAVLRGAKARMMLRERYTKVLIVRRFIQRWIGRWKGQQHLALLREDKAHAAAMRRRREEVEDASVLIQSVARMWLAQRRRHLLQQAALHLHRQATIIQSVYRSYCGRRRATQLQVKRMFEEGRRRVRQQMEHCAAKIQATWKMYRVRRDTADYLRFMLWDRHVVAVKIQLVWRQYEARLAVRRQREVMALLSESRQNVQVQWCAAVKLQSVIRMFLVRAALQRKVRLPYTPARLYRCAQSIQRLWRGVAARQYTLQLRLSRAWYDKEKVTAEAMHVYATMIQSLVRAKILNRRLVDQQRLTCGRSKEDAGLDDSSLRPTQDKPVVEVLCSVQRPLQQSVVTRVKTMVAYERNSSKMVIEKLKCLDAAHLQTMSSPSDETDDEEITASSTDGRSPNGTPLFPSPLALPYEPPSDPTFQSKVVSTRDPTLDSSVVLTPEMQKAALDIQRVWRGYMVRCTIEYYYEEYEEEVEVTETMEYGFTCAGNDNGADEMNV